ncbi:MAG: rod shape-determining protein RodA [Candidatus Hydrogenedentes bacterium]|nr:rod shape-determining protein RodA [Candidatus Hydrogenedentota bacterium]
MPYLLRDLALTHSNIGVFDRQNVRRLDPVLSLLVLSLIVVGLAVLTSASRNVSSSIPYYYAAKQVVWFLVGAGCAVLLVCVDYRFLVSLAPGMYALVVGLLIVVLLWGIEVKGGQRWLTLGLVRFQPSELGKIVLVYTLAWYFSVLQERIRRLPYFLLTFVIVGIPMLLILKQPNLGTAASLIPVVFVMLYAAGCKRWHLAVVILLGLVAAPLAWSQLKDYQKDRIRSFLNAEADPQDTGWHTIQTKITVGSGGMWGKGFREGTQTHLSYLPEHHTDFIFALLAEEEGFVGAVAILGLFAVFLLRGLMLARDCPDLSGSMLAVGVVTILGFHVFVNVGITIGLLPVTGLPLPFLSYGGSFCLTTMVGVGTLLSVQVRKGFFRT